MHVGTWQALGAALLLAVNCLCELPVEDSGTLFANTPMEGDHKMKSSFNYKFIFGLGYRSAALTAVVLLLNSANLFSQADTSLKYLGKYIIKYDGTINSDFGIVTIGDTSFTFYPATARDTFVQRRVYFTKDSAFFYFDVHVEDKLRILAKGFLRNDSPVIRHGRSWRYKQNGSLLTYGDYVNDKRQNDWVFVRNNGSVGAIISYDRGLVIGRSCYAYTFSDRVRTDSCDTEPDIKALIDSLQNKIDSYLVSQKASGRFQVPLALFFDRFGRIKGYSRVDVSEENSKYWKSVVHSISLLGQLNPVLSNGIEVGYDVFLQLSFARQPGSRFSSVAIEYTNTFYDKD